MLSLLCVVVNDGSVVLAEMEGKHVVTKLKETIKEKKMYTFPADELTLFVAKTDDGQWMHLSDDDEVKLRKREKVDAVEALLKKRPMNSVSRLDNRSFGFGADDAGEDGAVHVLVVVPAARWEEARSAKKAKTSAAPLAPPVEFTLDPSSVFVPTAVPERTLRCTKALSTAFQDFGGFPAEIFVRKEMQVVWTLLNDNYFGTDPSDVHYVLVGSPGVGKSALLLLFCCYLATRHGYWIFFSRSPKGEGGSIAPYVVLWFRGATVTGYPICVPDNIPALFADFYAEKMDNKFLIVGDGFREEELTGSMSLFASCHLLSTSAQFMPKSPDKRELLLLPAWQEVQLQALANKTGIVDFDERYAYSGGSAREFTRDLPKLKMKMAGVLKGLEEGTAKALQTNYSAPRNSGRDSIQRLFVTNVDNKDAYLIPETWLPIVDSSFALQYMARTFELSSITSMVQLAKSSKNGSLHGQMFEVLVHKLAHEKALKLDVRDSQDATTKSTAVNVPPDCAVKMGNDQENFFTLREVVKWAGCLTFLRERATTKMYWNPDYLRFAAVDSVLILNDVVYYLQMTVANRHDMKWDKILEIHQAVCANTALIHHTFKFVMVTPRKPEWGTFKGLQSGIHSSSGLPPLSMCEAQVDPAHA